MRNHAPVVDVRVASIDDLDAIAELFDGYRGFYEQDSDPARARRFLRNRLTEKDSVIFLASLDDVAAGFVQMYPSFSSVATARIWILNDLFVAPGARRKGVARALLEYAANWARRQGAVKLALETAGDNQAAKSLYELLGWALEDRFDRYELVL